MSVRVLVDWFGMIFFGQISCQHKGVRFRKRKIEFPILGSSRFCQVGKVECRIDLMKRFGWDSHHLSCFPIVKVRHGSRGGSIVGWHSCRWTPKFCWEADGPSREKGEGSVEQGGTVGKGTVGAPKRVWVDVGSGDRDAGALSKVVHCGGLQGRSLV